MPEEFICPICRRIIPLQHIEKHHSIPRSKKGKETILMCRNCGDALHQFFTNKQLEKEFNNLTAILANETVQKWALWIQKKPNDFNVCMKRKK